MRRTEMREPAIVADPSTQAGRTNLSPLLSAPVQLLPCVQCTICLAVVQKRSRFWSKPPSLPIVDE